MRVLLLMGLLYLALADPAQGAITRNSATYTRCTTDPCTVAHTVAGSDPLLAVCVTWWHYASTPSITTATWNGLPLTLQATAAQAACGGACQAALYILANPGAATADVSIGWSGALNDAVVGAVSFNGVAPTAPVGATVATVGNGSPASVTVPSNSGEVVLDCLGSIANGAVPTTASGQTQNWSDFGPVAYTHSASSYVAGQPSTVLQWTLSGAPPPWAMLGMPIRPVGGGGGGGSTPGTQRVISWVDNADNETCVHLQWQTDQSYPTWVDIQNCLPPNTVSYAHNIGTSTGDCYQVEATNAGGSNGFAGPVCAAAAPPPPPLPPPPSAIPTAMRFDVEEDLL